ncbi:hypothetical protein MCUN1_001824 [Malassezia cuniculi]|uniref:RNA polymerase II assembly factor Rtp1 C-terminal domain-containing protein n=1 Tax=Malassezia cuniculi TaxID=948313 RepID=A0AAF0J686_9BASI|nr:hypothetical protein MCUN1_001824 [Malassezia cuniculi]
MHSSSVRDAVAHAAVLAGARDEELSIPKARRVIGREVNRGALLLTDGLDAALRARLAHLPQAQPDSVDAVSGEQLERMTGSAALECMMGVHTALDTSKDATLGARDNAVLNRLLSVVANWLVTPSVTEFDSAFSRLYADSAQHTLTETCDSDISAYDAAAASLKSTANAFERVLASKNDLSSAIIRIYLADVLKVALRVAYALEVQQQISFIDTLLSSVPAQNAMAALRRASARDSGAPPVPKPVRDNAARLLSAQLVRPDGVRALIVGVLGSDGLDGDRDESLQRLEGVATILTTPPKYTPASTHVERLVPSLLAITDASSDAAQVARRAAVFTLVKLHEKYRDAVRDTLAKEIFVQLSQSGTPATAIKRVCALALLAPPSPDWMHEMVAPAIGSLLSLDTFAWLRTGVHDEKIVRIVDELADMARETVHAWLRIGDRDACVAALCESVSNSFSPSVEWALQGELVLAPGSDASISMPNHISTRDDEPVSSLARALHFAIDPARLAATVSHAKRKDIGADLFFSALEGYGRQQAQQDSGVGDVAPSELERRSVFYLQLLSHLHADFGNDIVQGDVDRTLRFISFALEGSSADANDSELVGTALNLLLAILEQQPGLTRESSPLLAVISDRLESLRDLGDAELRALVSEALLALSARTHAQECIIGAPKYKQVYQEAISYLQDPVLPVRAYGLALLTRLVSTDAKEYGQVYGNEIDPALLPAIFDMLVEAVQDEESFLYLNAVKGLSQMAAHWKEETLHPLMQLYVGGEKSQAAVDNSIRYGAPLSQRETDKRLRIGEALVQVLQYLGDAARPVLPRIVRPLLTALRNTNFSATLRSSFIAVLGTCVEGEPGAVASLTGSEIAEAAVDLVHVEGVNRPQRRTVRAYVNGEAAALDDSDDDQDRSGIDTDPKLPQLRRSALLLLAHAIRASRHMIEEYAEAQQRAPDASLTALRLPGGGLLPSIGDSIPQPTPPELLVPLSLVPRIRLIMQKTSALDTDALVRQQAEDCLKEAQEFEGAAVRLCI